MKMSSMVVLAGLIAAALPAAAGNDGQVSWIVNGTRSTMVAVQIRPSGSREWRPLTLREPLSFFGRVQGPAISGRCQLYDIQVLFDDGRRIIKVRQNLCLTGPYRISE